MTTSLVTGYHLAQFFFLFIVGSFHFLLSLWSSMYEGEFIIIWISDDWIFIFYSIFIKGDVIWWSFFTFTFDSLVLIICMHGTLTLLEIELDIFEYLLRETLFDCHVWTFIFGEIFICGYLAMCTSVKTVIDKLSLNSWFIRDNCINYDLIYFSFGGQSEVRSWKETWTIC